MTEDVERDSKGRLVSDGTWTYKPPTIDTIPQKMNMELFKSPAHKERVFSSKGTVSTSPCFDSRSNLSPLVTGSKVFDTSMELKCVCVA